MVFNAEGVRCVLDLDRGESRSSTSKSNVFYPIMSYPESNSVKERALHTSN